MKQFKCNKCHRRAKKQLIVGNWISYMCDKHYYEHMKKLKEGKK